MQNWNNILQYTYCQVRNVNNINRNTLYAELNSIQG